MILDRMTFTGADDNTGIDALYDISKEFKSVEWGILYYPEEMSTPRYPSREWINSFLENKPDSCHVSIHFCGNIVYRFPVRDPNSEFWKFIEAYNDKVDRIQLNFPRDRVLLDQVHRMFSQGLPRKICFLYEQWDINTIFQVNEGTEILVAALKLTEAPGLQFLRDASRGNGKTGDVTLSPVKGFMTGYAGGINPDNILGKLTTMAFITLPEGYHTWIDMESGVRTFVDVPQVGRDSRFDLQKVTLILDQYSRMKWTH